MIYSRQGLIGAILLEDSAHLLHGLCASPHLQGASVIYSRQGLEYTGRRTQRQNGVGGLGEGGSIVDRVDTDIGRTPRACASLQVRGGT